jgi:hypothetical protein
MNRRFDRRPLDINVGRAELILKTTIAARKAALDVLFEEAIPYVRVDLGLDRGLIYVWAGAKFIATQAELDEAGAIFANDGSPMNHEADMLRTAIRRFLRGEIAEVQKV